MQALPLIKQARSLTKTHYRKHLVTLGYTLGLGIILILVGQGIAPLQDQLLQDLKTHTMQSINIDLTTNIETLYPNAKAQLDQDIAAAKISFIKNRDHRGQIAIILLVILGVYFLQIQIAMGHIQTSGSLSTIETDYNLGTFFQNNHRIIGYIVLGILVSIATTIGFLFLIIPGIYIAIRLSLSSYALMIDNLGVFAAIKKSRTITSGNVRFLFKTYFLLGLLQIGGFLVFIVGIAWTLPVLWTTMGILYRTLGSTDHTNTN